MGNGGSVDITQRREELEGAPVETVLRWAWDTFGYQAAATSSFQSQSVPLLHLISQHVPDLPILFLDTGFHFPETLEFRDQLIDEFGLYVRSLEPRRISREVRQAPPVGPERGGGERRWGLSRLRGPRLGRRRGLVPPQVQAELGREPPPERVRREGWDRKADHVTSPPQRRSVEALPDLLPPNPFGDVGDIYKGSKFLGHSNVE